MTTNHETVAEAARHLLLAIDRGYFMDALLPSSAYVEALRQAIEAETDRPAFPRQAPRVSSPAQLGIGGRR